jgi:hypothetical protein
MSHGKPFAKPDPAQRAAFDAQLRRDGFDLLRDVGRATFQHMASRPDSVITQTVAAAERDTGVLTVLARGLNALMREEECRADDRARRAAAGEVVDAEFIDDEPTRT